MSHVGSNVDQKTESPENILYYKFIIIHVPILYTVILQFMRIVDILGLHFSWEIFLAPSGDFEPYFKVF